VISTTQPDKQVTFDLEGYLGESGVVDGRYKGRASLGLHEHEVNHLIRGSLRPTTIVQYTSFFDGVLLVRFLYDVFNQAHNEFHLFCDAITVQGIRN
jgi:hypothetical protein